MRTVKPPSTIVGLGFAALLLAGCTGDQSAPDAEFDEPPVPVQDENTLEDIQERGELVVGVKYDTRPFGYVPEGQGEPAGFDIDLATEFARRLGVDVDFVQVTTLNRTLNLETGKVDMILASMVRTDEREKTINFSLDYFSDEQLLLVPDGSDIGGIDDLDGATVSLAQGGVEEANLREVAPSVDVLAYQGWPEALQALMRGEADAVSSTLGLLTGLAASAEDAGADVEIVGDGFADGPVGAGFRLGDDELQQAFDDALIAMEEDGTYAEISEKWWGEVLDEPYDIEPAGN